MNAQEQYEMDESEQLLRAKEFLRQRHTHLCAAVMAVGGDCLCKMKDCLLKGKEGKR